MVRGHLPIESGGVVPEFQQQGVGLCHRGGIALLSAPPYNHRMRRLVRDSPELGHSTQVSDDCRCIVRRDAPGIRIPRQTFQRGAAFLWHAAKEAVDVDSVSSGNQYDLIAENRRHSQYDTGHPSDHSNPLL